MKKSSIKICNPISFGFSPFHFVFKMPVRRQGEGDAGVRPLYVEELTTKPTQLALEYGL